VRRRDPSRAELADALAAVRRELEDDLDRLRLSRMLAGATREQRDLVRRILAGGVAAAADAGDRPGRERMH
jgi:hypothetical protein